MSNKSKEKEYPTIYLDPDTCQRVEVYGITRIGSSNELSDKSLPGGIIVYQVGSSVKAVHYLKVPNNVIPPDIFKYAVNVVNFKNVFYHNDITMIPAGLFDNCQNAVKFQEAFCFCPYLKEVPKGLFDNCKKATNFEEVFSLCTQLETVPTDIFDKCDNIQNCSGAFAYDSNIRTPAPKLWKRNIPIHDSCFYNCMSMSDYNFIPRGWIVNHRFNYI